MSTPSSGSWLPVYLLFGGLLLVVVASVRVLESPRRNAGVGSIAVAGAILVLAARTRR